MPIIELKGLTKAYTPSVGSFEINLAINEGEVYGFIGPNGAGKSTVIKQMVGFLHSDKGEGKILNCDIWKETKEIMKDLGYVSGDVAIPEYMTGFNYLKTIAHVRGDVAWEYVEKLVEYFDLDWKRKIKKMSKGMKQKVSLIAAFMHKPKVLVLDEPTSGLDPLMQEKFNKLIKGYQQDGATIFMSSHIFGEIENTCDRVAFIKKGRIISEVSIKDMKNKINKIYQIKFATVKDYQEFLKQKWNILTKDDELKNIKLEVEEKKVKSLLKEFANFDVTDFKEISFSLEQHFLKYYQDEVNFND